MATASRFQPFSPHESLRKLKTAFSTTSSAASSTFSSPSPSSSTLSQRPFSRSVSSTPQSSPGSFGYASTATSPASSDCGCCDYPSHSAATSSHRGSHTGILGLSGLGGGLGGLQLMGIDSAMEGFVSQSIAAPKESAGRQRLRTLLSLKRRRLASKWNAKVEEDGKFAQVFEPRNDPVMIHSIFDVMTEARL